MTRRQAAKLNMLIVVAAGLGTCLFSFYNLPVRNLGLPFVLLTLVTIGVGSRVDIKIPSLKANVSIADTFIFLTILLFGGEAAVLVAVAEALVSSLRISKKPLTIAFNSAAMACSTFATVAVLRFCVGSTSDLLRSRGFLLLIAASCLMALVQYLVNSIIVAVACALRANQPIWETWEKYYLWMAVSYLSAALAAGLIASLSSIVGPYAFLAMAPIIAVVYFTYSTYLKNLGASLLQAEQSRRHLDELQRSEERFRSAFDHAPIGMALVAADGRWLKVNRSFCEIVGYAEHELLGMMFPLITHPEDLDRFLYQVSEVLEGRTATHQMEKRYIDKEGGEIWALVSISLLPNSQANPPQLIFQIHDITDRKRAEEQLLHDAFHDGLTGLPNRAWFIEQLQVALDGMRRSSKLFAVLFLDLDRFKVINDSIGHMCGDQLLIGIARRLQACLRPEDIIARLGGDEFTVLLTDLRDRSDAIAVAERIQKQVSRSFNLNGYETFTSGSIGIAFSNSGYDCPEDLLRDADTAMYQAKALGKAQHVIFDAGMHTRALHALQIESDMRRALDRKEFFLQYQPIVSLSSGCVTGFEALVRWRHPQHGIIPPNDFIPVAEETGLIVPLGQWVLREACSQMKAWQTLLFPSVALSISVNLSGKQLAYPDLIDQIINTLQSTGLDPRALKLEITESVVMENVEAATKMLERLRTLGVELVIDDFGTGYSSLSYLHKLPIDTLKIDRSFVGRIGENNENKEIVRTVVMLAQTLGKGVVAEGVETREQLQHLRDLRCDSAQGFLFSRPVDSAAALELVRSSSEWLYNDLFADKRAAAFDQLASNYSM